MTSADKTVFSFFSCSTYTVKVPYFPLPSLTNMKLAVINIQGSK